MLWLKKLLRNKIFSEWIYSNPKTVTTVIILIWTFSGLTGHDPWKPDEAHTFGVTYSIIEDNHMIPGLLCLQCDRRGELYRQNWLGDGKSGVSHVRQRIMRSECGGRGEKQFPPDKIDHLVLIFI